MNFSDMKNIGDLIKTQYVLMGSATAGGTGDATEIAGTVINRDGYLSGVLAVPYTATLAADKSLKLTISVAESSDGTNFDTAVKLKDAVTVATGKATTGSTETGLVEIDINLSGYKNYVKFSVTPDLTATGTDTCLVGATFALGGAERIPA
jgi:hypothetical protein